MSESCKFKRYIWELPVRWCHWINMVCIVTLAATGFFIGSPYSIGRSASDFAMGWIRFVLWSLIGNEYAGWRAFLPFLTSRGRLKMVRMLRYYLLIDKEVPETVGHNPLATTAYMALFAVYVMMILTGFSLYAQHAPQGVMHTSLGFMYAMFSDQGMRLTHHLGMYMIFGFVVNHIYSAWLMDIKEHGSEISSMFSGYKFTVHKEKD